VNDPPFGEAGSAYSSLRDEITGRADHNAAQYHVDNAKVFELLNEAVTEHKHVKTWIKPFAKARDGRGAWLAFKAHYRGSSEMEAIEAKAEHQLDTAVYKGERPRYNFETHVSTHRKSHQELARATGQEINGSSKVRRLLKSLQAPQMAVPCATVRAHDTLRTDFDACVNYLRAFISSSNDQDVRNIAGLDRKKRGRSDKGKTQWPKKGGNRGRSPKGDAKALDRYYKPEEWRKLDKDTQDKILQMRKKRNISKVKSEGKEKTIRWKDKEDIESDDGSSLDLQTSQRSKKSKRDSK
jgi:hypothetical protein